MGSEIRRNSEVSCWQQAMRTALYDGVSEGDIGEIVRQVVKKAKAGDLKAAEFLFRWTMGRQELKVQNAVFLADPSGPRESDPSPEEIAQKTLQIREARGRSKLMG
jgi:hypothetical protein